MAKTRSRTSALKIKKEEDCKDQLKRALHPNRSSSSDISATRGKKTKRNASNRKKPLLSQVKVEEENDNKSLLQVSKRKAYKKLQPITKEQIEQLIHYIVKDGMTAAKASKKVSITPNSGYKYYNQYLSDPERRIPLPSRNYRKKTIPITQDQINKLIQYIVEDKMTINHASKKVNISLRSGKRYYNMYLNSPNNGIPIPGANTTKRGKPCTQDQINELFGYILDEKIPLETAAIKCNMTTGTARRYYNIYLNDPNSGIPVARVNSPNGKYYTQNQINKLISYIIEDKVPIGIAAVKCNMSLLAARRYYQLYLNSPSKEIPRARTGGKLFSQEQINNLIRFIVNDDMSILQASVKVNMGYNAARIYYSLYQNDPHHQIPTPKRCIPVLTTKSQLTELFDYVDNGELGLSSAAKKLKINASTAYKYYRLYKRCPQYKIPERIGRKHPEECVKKLIDYITVNKLTVKAAAKMLGMCYGSALFYYRKFRQNSQNDNITSGTV